LEHIAGAIAEITPCTFGHRYDPCLRQLLAGSEP
jgi:hypothetical protein